MSDVTLYTWDEMPMEELSPTIGRKLVSGEKGMVAHVHLKKGALVPLHAHENEQFTYLLSGSLEFRIGANREKTVVISAGQIMHIPANLPHEAVALEDTLDVDLFVPPREDWLNKTDDYLRGGS